MKKSGPPRASRIILTLAFLSTRLLAQIAEVNSGPPTETPPPDFAKSLRPPLASEVFNFHGEMRKDAGGIPVDTSFPCLHWFPQGPAPTTNADVNMPPDHPSVGAVHTVAPHPSNSNIVYLASVNGGVWVTTNATATNYTWTPLTDDQPSLSCGGMAIDPADATGNTLVVAIGRRSSLGSAFGGALIGLLRSTNGGANWTVLNPDNALSDRNFNSICARGSTIMAGSDNGPSPGLYRSTNAGGSFTLISGTGGTGLPAGAVMYLVADPDNASRYYLFVKGVGVYRSTDSGATWVNVNSGVAQFVTTSAALAVHGRAGTSVVYAATINGRGVPSDVFRSTNAGANWIQMDSVSANTTGGHNALVADPLNPNLVYIAGEYTRGSFPYTAYTSRGDAAKTNGAQWTPLVDLDGFGGAFGNAPHTDARSLAFDAAGYLWEGDDGGIYRLTSPQTSTNGATTNGVLAWTSYNTGLFVTEMHHVAYDHVNGTLLGGTQDQGSPSQVAKRSPIWKKDANGDASGVAVEYGTSPGNSVRYYSSQYLGGLKRETRNSLNQIISSVFASLTPTAGSPSFVGQFVTPFAVNKVDPARLIFGGVNSIYESTNRATTITFISTASLNMFAKIAYGGRLGAVTNVGALYACSGNLVGVRTNVDVDLVAAPVAFPGSSAESVVMKPDDWRVAYVIAPTNVYVTTNAGNGWIDLTGNLAGVGTFNTMDYLTLPGGDALAVGTDLGVYLMRIASPGVWQKLGDNLPNAPVFELWYDATDNVLAATLFGRGAWTFNFDVPTFVVSSLADSGAGTLREAMGWVNLQGCGIISLAVTGTINLASSLPFLTANATIVGPGTNNLAINGAGAYSIFGFGSGTSNKLSGVRLVNAFSTGHGASVRNLGYTVLENCVISNSLTVQSLGGAVCNFQGGLLFATNCLFANNSVRGGNGESRPEGSTSGGGGGGGAGVGGAIYSDGPQLALHGCAFIGNSAGGGNGGNGGGNQGTDSRGGDGGDPNRGVGGAANNPGGNGGFGGGGGGGGGSAVLTTDNGGLGGFGGGGGGAGARRTGASGGTGGAGGQYGGAGGTSQFSFAAGGGGGAGLGGAIFAGTGVVTVVNCQFSGNLATNGLAGTGSFGSGNGGSGQGWGGALFNLSANVCYQNVTFTGNSASSGQADIDFSTQVVNLDDSGPGSLRQAICNAAAHPGNDTVTFASNLSGGVIHLTSEQLEIEDTSGEVAITAADLPRGITISGEGARRAFRIAPGSVATLDSLTVTNCVASGSTVDAADGAGALNLGQLFISRCTFIGNQARYGGGVDSEPGSTLTLANSTFTKNSCTLAGGAVSMAGTSSIQHCTITSNSAAMGGGLAVSGGATLTHSVVALNSATNGPEITQASSYAAESFNLIGNGAASGLINGVNGDIVGNVGLLADPRLGALRDNGGPTLTQYPRAGSPVLDAGNPAFSGAGLSDQRGQPRVWPGRVDIGAVEFVPAGNALIFDGVDGYAILTNAGLSLPTNEITIEFWERVETVRNQFSFILFPDVITNRASFSSLRANLTTYWDFGDLFNGGRVNYSTPLDNLTNWTHWALVSTSAGHAMRVYRNGILDASSATNRSFVHYAAALVLGARLDAPQEFFKGELDEFRIWTVARTQTEIQSALHNGICAPQPNLWGYWKFDEATGSTAFDSSGNGRHLTLVNGVGRSSSFAPLSAPGTLNLVRTSPTEVRLFWNPNAGCLQSASAVTGPWSEFPGATNGQIIVTTPARQFFRMAQ